MKSITSAVLLVSTLMSVSVASADSAFTVCSADMPLQLRQDCIVVEGAGASFPDESYAYKREYYEWLALKTDKAAAMVVAVSNSGDCGD